MTQPNSIRMAEALHQTRRQFMGAGLALGGMYMAHQAQAGPLAPKSPAKAKAVIYLHMSGSPPQQDLFDYKPELKKHHLQPCPDSLL